MIQKRCWAILENTSLWLYPKDCVNFLQQWSVVWILEQKGMVGLI